MSRPQVVSAATNPIARPDLERLAAREEAAIARAAAAAVEMLAGMILLRREAAAELGLDLTDEEIATDIAASLRRRTHARARETR